MDSAPGTADPNGGSRAGRMKPFHTVTLIEFKRVATVHFAKSYYPHQEPTDDQDPATGEMTTVLPLGKLEDLPLACSETLAAPFPRTTT
jgi:hypothetical protein